MSALSVALEVKINQKMNGTFSNPIKAETREIESRVVNWRIKNNPK